MRAAAMLGRAPEDASASSRPGTVMRSELTHSRFSTGARASRCILTPTFVSAAPTRRGQVSMAGELFVEFMGPYLPNGAATQLIHTRPSSVCKRSLEAFILY